MVLNRKCRNPRAFVLTKVEKSPRHKFRDAATSFSLDKIVVGAYPIRIDYVRLAGGGGG